MTVNSYLTGLASSLVLSEDERASIATSISTLSTRLNGHFNNGVRTVTNHFQFGSSTRGTMLPREADNDSDIDYMVVFDTSGGQMKPQTYLDRLKRFTELKYSTSERTQSTPTIVLTLGHIKFEIVPAIYNGVYQIPSPSSSWMDWMYTDPSGTTKALEEKNKSNGSLIKPLVRLVKYWNARNGHYFQSFSIEEYIINSYFPYNSNLKDYFYYFWSFFGCSPDSPQYIKDRVAKAKEIATKAQQYENSGMPATAESEIQKILPAL